MQTNNIFDLQKLSESTQLNVPRQHIQACLSNNIQKDSFIKKFQWMLKTQRFLFAHAVTVTEEILFNAFVLDLPWLS